MEVLRIPVPCACVPEAVHHVELGLISKPRVQLKSMRTPCDRAEADAVDRLGGITCLGMFADVRELLAEGSNFTSEDALARQVAAALRGPIGAIDPFEDEANPLDVSLAARAAARLRDTRKSARARMMTTAEMTAAGWLPGHVRLAHTERLFDARLARCWPGDAGPSDIRINLRLKRPQIQISWGMIEKQPVYEFDGTRWVLTKGDSTIGYTLMYGGASAILDGILPASAMRGALLVRNRR